MSDLLFILLACRYYIYFFFFFNDTATTEIYTLSLHDALPISRGRTTCCDSSLRRPPRSSTPSSATLAWVSRSEEHTSELQSQSNLVCRLLLEKKKKKKTIHICATTTHIDTDV